jgi:hypothetical protein
LLLAVAVAAAAHADPKKPAPAVRPDNPNCTVTVPRDPLTAQGLATPYLLSSNAPNEGSCHQANAAQSAFVEATILDPATGSLTIYRPLVIDQGTRPAAQPVMPTLPPNAVVGVWFGFNGNTLTLRGTGNSLELGHCANGLPSSPFGQFAYCNAPGFFSSALDAIRARRLVIPDVGTARDGLPCPTTRDFSLVDQDQSDNVTTTYLAVEGGRTAQSSAANSARLRGAQTLTNTAPDLTNNRAPTPSLALNELQAAAHQAAPAALVPLIDPMTQVNGRPSVAKVNLYRAGVDQPAIDPRAETRQTYCQNLRTIGRKRLMTDRRLFLTAPSPGSATGVGLFDFLNQRLQSSIQLLGCGGPTE